MSLKNNEIPTSIFYSYANGSNDGSVFANKTFHIVYYILKHDFVSKLKTIIGILYNEADEDSNNKLYFNCIMPLKEIFTVPYLLKNIIYKPRYDKDRMRRIMTEEQNTRSILQYADKILMSKINNRK